MRKIQNKKSGFTLIELMIVVAILGILAAIAIPAFATYIRRSKAAEASLGLDNLFKATAAYYNKEFATGSGITASTVAHCEVGAASSLVGGPSDVKQPPLTPADADFAEATGIGFTPGYNYYNFSNNSAGAGCARTSTRQSHILTAVGNLDGDSTSSLFSLATATNEGNEMYKAGQMFISNELE